jgi:Flp pilus assembly pilin Flp
MNLLLRFIREDGGQDMVEYGLLGSFISIAAIVAARAIGPPVTGLYEKILIALKLVLRSVVGQ